MATLKEFTSSVGMNPPEEIRAKLVSQAPRWQMIPDIAVKALAMARDPKCSFKEFASVIERDPKLATEILRITNRAFYAGRTPILNLSQAVIRLGLAHCRNVIVAASIGNGMRRLPLSEAWMQMVLWRHSVLTAMISVTLNRDFRLGFGGEEFTAGLIHDLGRFLLAAVVPGQFADADKLELDEPEGFLWRERNVLQTDHCEVGAWFGAFNNLPQALVDVLRFHHSPDLAVENQKLIALTAAADHMANYLQRQGTADGYEPEENAAANLLFDRDAGHRGRFMSTAPSVMAETLREAGASEGLFCAM
jgi:HD-like signal output (HDOD) protein